MTKEELTAMTHDQRRDWLATKYGWCYMPDRGLWRHEDDYCQPHHPIPDTLDAVAGLMPKGWKWTRERDGKTVWYSALPRGWDGEEYPSVMDTGDEKADRLRLACLCLLADREASK